jgi:hypothetical protein
VRVIPVNKLLGEHLAGLVGAVRQAAASRQPLINDPIILDPRLWGVPGSEVVIDSVQRNDGLTGRLVATIGRNARLGSIGGHATPHCLHEFGSIPVDALRRLSRFRSPYLTQATSL